MRGYKVFNPNWTCKNFQFEVGKTFEEDVDLECCSRGFHFCTKLVDCFRYYSFDPNNRVAEIEALGDIVTHEDDSKCATNKIHIVKELSWQEVLDMVNTGIGCTGFKNTGHMNTGKQNTGDMNTGHMNTGNMNTGHMNTGHMNTGNRNTGHMNTGDRNTGNRNTGYMNTGDWNKSNFSNGCFCNTQNNTIPFFNKPSNWTYQDWETSDAYRLLNSIDCTPTEWIYENDMTEKEKEQNPSYKTTGGYLKVRDLSNCCLEWWQTLNIGEKNVIMSMPNFDKDVFKDITGIDVNM